MKSIKANLANIAIVLHQPRYPENIGAAARCAMNMGIGKIVAVNPANPEREKMLKMATHEAAHLIDNMAVYDDLTVALAPFQYIVGTTARLGRHRQAQETPHELAGRITELSQNNQIALLFGPENTGLSNEEIRYCHITTSIPTAGFASLNLAQAVIIICYEIFMASNAAPSIAHITPRLATFEELQGMYADLRETLLTMGFLKSEGQEYGLNQVRAFLSRVKLFSRETQLIRGICRQIKWFKKNS